PRFKLVKVGWSFVRSPRANQYQNIRNIMQSNGLMWRNASMVADKKVCPEKRFTATVMAITSRNPAPKNKCTLQLGDNLLEIIGTSCRRCEFQLYTNSVPTSSKEITERDGC